VIALVDYGAGNLTSVRKAFAALDAPVFTPDSPATLSAAHAIVVPGVGHFGATGALGAEWVRAIRDAVDAGRPLLGICLGMQWLFEGSDEAPDCGGLGVLAGRCRRFSGIDETGVPLKVPHVGWNDLAIARADSIVADVEPGSQVYFTHSFVAPVTSDTVAVTRHGEPFAAIVQRGRIAGVQFHPEKSGDVGLQILRNWIRLAASHAQ
jgi:glutamine amidotransferase